MVLDVCVTWFWMQKIREVVDKIVMEGAGMGVEGHLAIPIMQ